MSSFKFNGSRRFPPSNEKHGNSINCSLGLCTFRELICPCLRQYLLFPEGNNFHLNDGERVLAIVGLEFGEWLLEGLIVMK